MVTPKQRQIGKKRDVQEMEIDDAFGSPTPQHLTNEMRSVSQEKKQENQIKQAAKMITTRSKEIKKIVGGWCSRYSSTRFKSRKS
jgi:hypothetical protein